MKAITEMSLFNGCEGASMALSELNIPVKKMYASEVDKFATKAAKLLFPNTIHLGDVTKWREWDIDWSEIDKLDAGSPCQGFSAAGKKGGTKAVIIGESGRNVEMIITSLVEYEFTRKLKLSGVSVEYLSCSYLFWEFVAILEHIKSVNPDVKFMLENVMMTKNNLDMISKAVGVEPVMINAALVTAQNRKRNYWTNWHVSQPEDKGILLKDIIEKPPTENATIMSDAFADRQKGRKCLVDEPKDKGASLCAMEYLKNGRQGDYIQCDEQGNQAVFRPCELRENKKPLTFIEWGIKYKQDEFGYCVDSADLKDLQEKYMLGGREKIGGSFEVDYEYDSYLHNFLYGKGSPLCHHVANTTDIKANESNKRVYADTGKAPTLTTMGGGHREPKVLVGRVVGRKINPETGKRDDYNPDLKIVQRLEARPDEKSGCITTVQKDNVLITDHPKYRKLTPRECMRLQGFPTWCIDKLHETEIVNGKEKPVISNSQKYKMTGNGWAIPVITHILQDLLKTGWMQ